VEVRDPRGRPVFRRILTRRRFRAGVATRFTLAWIVPRGGPPGVHIVRVAVRAPRGRALYALNARAARVVVAP